MQEDKTPKIFISYSWSSDELVLQLAERLVSHGVNVILDKWDLREGQDKYAFMEQCVNDPEIDKVLIICDRKYTEKANNREGGVGDETVIISTEIYNNVKQEKFIPIVAERDEHGAPFTPTYIKSRIYIDLSDNEKYESEYEKLLRNIYEQPIFKKPKLGSKPEWLETDRVNFFPLKDLIRQIIGATDNNKQISLLRHFVFQHIEILKKYYSPDISNGKQVYEIWSELKTVRDYYLEWLETLLYISCDIGDILCGCFEKMYNTLTFIKTFNENSTSCRENGFEIYHVYIWELFICTVAFLRHYERYDVLNNILSNTYFLIESSWGGGTKPANYARFRYYSDMLEKYKKETDKRNLFTFMGNVLCTEREKKPIYTKENLAQADLFLYQVFGAFDLVNNKTDYRDQYWFPTCYIYTSEYNNEWEKLKSKKYCKKICKLFGAEDIEGLKQKVAKCTYDRNMGYEQSFNRAPFILNCIKIEDIGTLN